MDQQPAKNDGHRQEIVTILAILVIAVVVVAAVVVANKKSDSTDAAATSQTNKDGAASSQQSDTNNSSSSSSESDDYKDGSYTATGSYDSPGGTEKITISVTLKDGTITDTSATGGATDREGEEYQSQFIAAYKDLVVGKSIDSVSLSRVSGSSLTSQGFNSALTQIKQDAAS